MFPKLTWKPTFQIKTKVRSLFFQISGKIVSTQNPAAVESCWVLLNQLVAR
ncbi:hypothetical protein LC605_31100 [Nostoc sp. CHAB 5836]|uniref:hypothetical protein n=1 Tax=Nostoc sp. CHAB 5836 TaxID=2780404 RepID=UPI001E59E89F|nr:hypothetical protein [Nostoc sp. CHAB 5836]MCC5619431.1 hypothetical protein [Nostoc sp. CHAB 5836]